MAMQARILSSHAPKVQALPFVGAVRTLPNTDMRATSDDFAKTLASQKVDRQSQDSFPASDPPSYCGSAIVGAPRRAAARAQQPRLRVDGGGLGRGLGTRVLQKRTNIHSGGK